MDVATLALRPATGGNGRRLALILATVVVVDLVAAVAIVNQQLQPLLWLLPAAASAAIVWRWPLAGCCLVLVLVTSVLSSSIFVIPAGPFQLRIHELALLGVVAVAILRPRRRWFGGAAGACLAGAMSLVAVSTVAAVLGGTVSAGDAVAVGRPLLLYLLFFAVVRLFPTPQTLRPLLVFASALAAVSGVVAALAATLPAVRGLLPPGSEAFLTSDPTYGGLMRARLPGAALAYGLFPFILVQVLRAERRRAWWMAALVGAAAGIAFSLNRNMWIGVLFSCALLFLLGGVEVRRRFAIGLVLAAASIAVLSTQGLNVTNDRALGPLVKRATTLLDPRAVSSETSLRDRERESTRAIAAIKANPLLGIGAGTAFGVTYREEISPGRLQRTEQLFLHNQYLFLALIGGIPALVLFIGFLGTSVWRGWRARADPVAVSLLVGLAAIALSALVMISFADDNMIAALCLVAAGCVVTGSRNALRGQAVEPGDRMNVERPSIGVAQSEQRA